MQRFLSFSGAALIGASMVIASSPNAFAQTADLYINAVDLDIKPGEMPKFLEAIKENGAASVKDEPGCREFNIVVSRTDPNHVFLFEVYDNEAAVQAHRNTEHFKKWVAATSSMIVGRSVRPMSSVALNTKSR